jgi:hypothetical protein
MDFTSPAWDLVPSGRFPALADFTLTSRGAWWGHGEREGKGDGEGGRRLRRALEAAAGTLTRLDISDNSDWPDVDTPETVCYELGAAIGKLRRLRSLTLGLTEDGRVYHAVARGLVESGGCPSLFELSFGRLSSNAECLTFEPRLIVPSVRVLRVTVLPDEAVMLSCGLLQVGYTHKVVPQLVAEDFDPEAGEAGCFVHDVLVSSGCIVLGC